MYKSLVLMMLFIFTCNQFVVSQSAWVKEKDEGYVQVAYNSIPSYNRIFNQKETKYLLVET